MKIMKDAGFDYLNKKSIVNPQKAEGVISSKTYDGWENVSQVTQFPGRIQKSVIPLDFSYYQMAILTKVEAGVTVGRHSHAEPVFRFVLKGDLTINGIEHGLGDWILVPSDTPYEVSTKTGYTILANYGQKCGAPPDELIKKSHMGNKANP